MWTVIDSRDEASEAAYNSNVQLWTLYGIGCVVTLLRTYSQCKDLGWRRLRLDDYLIWVAIVGTKADYFFLIVSGSMLIHWLSVGILHCASGIGV